MKSDKTNNVNIVGVLTQYSVTTVASTLLLKKTVVICMTLRSICPDCRPQRKSHNMESKKAPYCPFKRNQGKRKDLHCMMHKHISQTLITHGLFHSRGVERETFSNRNVLDLSITPFVDLVAARNQHIPVEIDGKKKQRLGLL